MTSLLNLVLDDSRKVVIPCFSSLSRSLDVMTAKRLSSPGFMAGVFFAFIWARRAAGG